MLELGHDRRLLTVIDNEIKLFIFGGLMAFRLEDSGQSNASNRTGFRDKKGEDCSSPRGPETAGSLFQAELSTDYHWPVPVR
jgi:hypothetical protein